MKGIKIMEIKYLVKNVPEYAWNHNYWVVTELGEDLWFYGAYDSSDKANQIALDLDKIVISD